MAEMRAYRLWGGASALRKIQTDMMELDFVVCQLKVWRTDEDQKDGHIINPLTLLGSDCITVFILFFLFLFKLCNIYYTSCSLDTYRQVQIQKYLLKSACFQHDTNACLSLCVGSDGC